MGDRPDPRGARRPRGGGQSSDTGIRQARAKTDRLDALALAKLLAAGSLDAIWMPGEPVRAMRRRLARRSQLVGARSRVKNEVHAVLVRCLKGRPPASDLFGRKGRAWLGELELPAEERETVDAGLRQIAFSIARSPRSSGSSRCRPCSGRRSAG